MDELHVAPALANPKPVLRIRLGPDSFSLLATYRPACRRRQPTDARPSRGRPRQDASLLKSVTIPLLTYDGAGHRASRTTRTLARRRHSLARPDAPLVDPRRPGRLLPRDGKDLGLNRSTHCRIRLNRPESVRRTHNADWCPAQGGAGLGRRLPLDRSGLGDVVGLNHVAAVDTAAGSQRDQDLRCNQEHAQPPELPVAANEPVQREDRRDGDGQR
jgi:hypothetical protein